MRRVSKNYADWIGLGPGGLPANVIGWSVATALRPLGRDPMTVRGDSAVGSQWHLPKRRGTRPPVAPFPIPHRQIEDTADAALIDAMIDVVASHANESTSRLYLDRSRFERRGDALYVSEQSRRPARVVKARAEIAHVHAGDGSLHVVARPADAQQLIDSGWGELHPLAGRRVIGLPESYVLLYAPRDADDLRQLTSIVQRIVTTAL